MSATSEEQRRLEKLRTIIADDLASGRTLIIQKEKIAICFFDTTTGKILPGVEEVQSGPMMIMRAPTGEELDALFGDIIINDYVVIDDINLMRNDEPNVCWVPRIVLLGSCELALTFFKIVDLDSVPHVRTGMGTQV